MKRFRILLLFVFLLGTLMSSFSEALDAPADAELKNLLRELPVKEQEMYRVQPEDFYPILEYAVRRDYNLFELLNLSYLELEKMNKRLAFSKTVLAAIEEKYNLGGSKMHIVFPFEIMERLELGARLNKKDNPLDAFIEEKYSADFYGFGDLHEDTHFGFEKIELNYFRDAFGMHAKRMFFTFAVSHIKLYEPRHVAIHLKNFFKPKKETFWAVKKN
ncbi:MAG: hypothetical protein U5P10_05740 [Spirochaetia bacterium]|nr:hypothetical protein [Spirochaetia bacterium]